jgi:tRNA(Ile)-lysidine synthase
VSESMQSRFARAVAALIGDASAEARFGIAVSGGPDSMALLHLAAQQFPGHIEAATVDHGLRDASADEAAMVAVWCADHGIVHATLRPAQPISGSVQAEARDARYALLEVWRRERGLDWLMTAHHADDQLETMVMRLNRSSGVAGLAGVRARREALLRPLLGIRRSELEAYVQAEGLPFVSDPSNSDDRFDRARLRKHLAHASWLDPVAAARSAAALADSEDAIEWMADQLYARHVVREGVNFVLTEIDFPRELLRRLLIRMIAACAPDVPIPRGERIDQAIIQLSCAKRVSIGACVATGGSRWSVRRAPPRRTG